MLVHFFVETRIRPCYMYIHEDELTQDLVLPAAHSLWALLRGIMIDRLSSWRGCLDLDYSPSKPSSKMARFAAATCSLYLYSLAS